MKNKRLKSITLGLFFLLAGFSILLFVDLKKEEQVEEHDSLALSNDQPGNAVELEAVDEPKEEKKMLTADVDKKAIPSSVKAYHELRSEENVDIRFYGIVVDQDGNGLPEAEIIYEVSGYNESLEEQLEGDQNSTFKESHSVTSDHSGQFSVIGVEGRVLWITDIKKDGYFLLEGFKSGFTYGKRFGGKHAPDQENPVAFKLGKRNDAVSLDPVNLRFDTMADGSLTYIDLISNRRLTNADGLGFGISVAVEKEVTDERQYRWSFEVSATNGELIESEDNTIFEAPQDGYQKDLKYEFAPGDAFWNMRAEKKFYIRSSSEEKHAGLHIVVFSYRDGGARVILKGMLNQSGSIVAKK